MSTRQWRINEFYGVDQSKDGSFLNEGSARDTRNMDTTDGNLKVAKGYVKHIETPVPGTGVVRRLAIMKMLHEQIFFAIAPDEDGNIALWSFDNTPEGYGWVKGYTYPADVKGTYWDIVQCNIGDNDFMIFANGSHQMVKWDGVHREAELFGTGETAYESTVSAYSNKVVTLAGAFTKEIGDRMKAQGLVLKDVSNAVESYNVSSKTVTLKTAPTTAPVSGDAAKVRGGLSNIKNNYLALHYSRLFSAGDPDNPSRLYYSQIPGDGRTIEDWGATEASPNSSGGFVEVGDTTGDPIVGLKALSTQLLIYKRYSVYRLLGDRPANFTLERVDAEPERLAHTSVVMHADIAFYLTPAGMYYFNNITAQPMPDAKNIREFLNGALLSQCKACENADLLYFTCYKGDNPDRDYDNHMIVYDIRRRAYTIRDGFEVADIAALDGKIYMIGPDRIICRFNEGTTYDGKRINAYWLTQRTDWQQKAVRKKIDHIYFNAAGERLIIKIISGANTAMHDQALVERDGFIYDIQPQADYDPAFQFRVENIAGSQFEISGGMEAYIKAEDRPR